MFQILDKIFPQDITNNIAGFICDDYLVDPELHKRIYHNKRDIFDLPVPKPQFLHSVWRRRYRNPYCCEGAKLEAYKYVDLPKERLPFIISRSFLKFQRDIRVDCDCSGVPPQAHMIYHCVNAIFDAGAKLNRKKFVKLGADISIPLAILSIVNEFYIEDKLPPVYNMWVKLKPWYQWERAAEIYKEMIIKNKEYPFFSVLWRWLYNYI